MHNLAFLASLPIIANRSILISLVLPTADKVPIQIVMRQLFDYLASKIFLPTNSSICSKHPAGHIPTRFAKNNQDSSTHLVMHPPKRNILTV